MISDATKRCIRLMDDVEKQVPIPPNEVDRELMVKSIVTAAIFMTDTPEDRIIQVFLPLYIISLRNEDPEERALMRDIRERVLDHLEEVIDADNIKLGVV